MTDFRLHCVVCDNAMDYFKYLLKNYRDLASPSARFEVIAHCTDDACVQQIKDENLADKIIPVHRRPGYYVYGNRVDVLNRVKLFFGGSPALSGSSGHAAGLNSFFQESGNGKIDIIADTDTVMLVKNWDLVLADILSRVDIIGTTYEKKGGVSSGSGNVQTYKDRVNLTWAAVSPRVSLKKLDASHRLWKNLPIETQEDADTFGLNVGDTLLRDVGWKLPKFLYDNKYKAAILENVYPETGRCKVLKVANGYNEEYQLDGAPFLVHQRGSRKHPFRSQPLSAPFYDAAEQYIAANETHESIKLAVNS